MPNYNYAKDKPIANKTEMQVADIICSKTGYALEEVGKDHKYDLKFYRFKSLVEKEVFTVEVKEDFTCKTTGNVGLEFECRGKPSGISTSEANYYCYKIHEPSGKIGLYLIKTKDLKTLITDKLYKRIINGGDVGSNSMNYLFPLEIIKDHSRYYGEVNE